MFNDFIKYFGKFLLFMAAGLGLGWVAMNTPRDYVPFLFLSIFIILGAWYAAQRARIDKEYRDSIKADEERRKNIKPRRYGGAK